MFKNLQQNRSSVMNRSKRLVCIVAMFSSATSVPMCAVFETLNSRGMDCHSYDMRSYGKSEPDAKQRGKITDFERLVNDFVAFCKLVQQGETMLALIKHVGRLRQLGCVLEPGEMCSDHHYCCCHGCNSALSICHPLLH